ncbi:MAG: hypothetical protein ABGY42_11395 [bacterium]
MSDQDDIRDLCFQYTYQLDDGEFDDVASLLAHAVSTLRSEAPPGEVADAYRPANIVGRSKAMLSVFEQIDQVAQADATVLLRGESDPATELRFSAATRLLGEAAAAAYSANAEIMLLTFARPEQLVAPELRHGNQRLAAAALAHGIETIDPSPELAGEGELLGLYLFPGDHHPSARGHALIAAVLAEAIQRSSSAACAAD